MALGDKYDNNKREQYTPVYYSSYNAGNPNGVDPSSLNYAFYNRMLKITISPVKVVNGDKITYDHENGATVWLTHTKARLLRDEVLKVLNGEISNGGVPTGSEGLIRFCDGKELGVNNYCLIINKVNENGEVTASYAYEFKTKHHYGVENFDPNTAKHSKSYYNDLEIKQLLDMLETYYMSMTGAIAYSVMEGNRFSTNTVNTKLDLLMSKLGVEYKPGTTSRSSSTSSYFDTNRGSSNDSDRSMRTATMEDLDS